MCPIPNALARVFHRLSTTRVVVVHGKRHKPKITKFHRFFFENITTGPQNRLCLLSLAWFHKNPPHSGRGSPGKTQNLIKSHEICVFGGLQKTCTKGKSDPQITGQSWVHVPTLGIDSPTCVSSKGRCAQSPTLWPVILQAPGNCSSPKRSTIGAPPSARGSLLDLLDCR